MKNYLGGKLTLTQSARKYNGIGDKKQPKKRFFMVYQEIPALIELL
jgi:hypothetical protein